MTTAPAIAAQPKAEAWHSMSAEEVLGKLGSAATGLPADASRAWVRVIRTDEELMIARSVCGILGLYRR